MLAHVHVLAGMDTLAENAAAPAAAATGPGGGDLMTGFVRACGIMTVAVLASTRPALAQDRLLPDVRYMRAPAAEPLAPRLSVGVMRTTLLAAPGPERPPFAVEGAAQDIVATVSLGAVFPLLRLAEWEGGGALLVLDGRVFGRFRLQTGTRDDMGQDWVVASGIEAARHRWSARAALTHRSAHIGDEFAQRTGAERIEFGGEQLDLLAAREIPGLVRVYGGGSWIFRSYLRWDERFRKMGIRDRGALQAGADREWQPWQDPRFRVFAGVDVHAAERTGWHAGYAAALGLGVSDGRSLRLLLRAYDGSSPMGEFFLTHERYISLELSAEF
jgi:hypothetical protein